MSCKQLDPTDTALEAFGQAAMETRKEAGLTQQAVADRAGLSVTTVRRVESGKGNPTFDTVLALADALDIEGSSSSLRNAARLASRTDRIREGR